MDFDQIRKYWEERAASDLSAQSTTQDYFLREIECRVLKESIEQHHPSSVIDIGCGDARTTIRLATEHEEISFFGCDYSQAMVKNAKDNLDTASITNLTISSCDISKPIQGKFDMAYTTRCLINLPDWELQKKAIKHIYDVLNSGGVYVMIENFIEGHDNFNRVRDAFGLPKISVREHNLFFKREQLLSFLSDKFEIINDTNISSSYYLVSRIIYSKICQEDRSSPDYFNEHHRYASMLPFCGEYGPVRMLYLKKSI